MRMMLGLIAVGIYERMKDMSQLGGGMNFYGELPTAITWLSILIIPGTRINDLETAEGRAF